MEPRFVYISGGYDQNFVILKDVERYDSIRDRWESLPELNYARMNHSSCTLGNTLYVIGGWDAYFDYGARNSIEKLSNIDVDIIYDSDTSEFNGFYNHWQLIKPINSFRPRTCPAFCAWNKHEIIILGGVGGHE